MGYVFIRFIQISVEFDLSRTDCKIAKRKRFCLTAKISVLPSLDPNTLFSDGKSVSVVA